MSSCIRVWLINNFQCKMFLFFLQHCSSHWQTSRNRAVLSISNFWWLLQFSDLLRIPFGGVRPSPNDQMDRGRLLASVVLKGHALLTYMHGIWQDAAMQIRIIPKNLHPPHNHNIFRIKQNCLILVIKQLITLYHPHKHTCTIQRD